MKNLLNFSLSLLILLSVTACNTRSPYETWKEAAKTNIRLLPKYGLAKKSPGQLQADQEFIKTVVKQFGSAAKASQAHVKFGFQYLNEGNLQTSMYRFNQAWLLNPENPDVYWGFGAVYFKFQDYYKAVLQYDEGLQINPKHEGILKDRTEALRLTKKAF